MMMNFNEPFFTYLKGIVEEVNEKLKSHKQGGLF